MARGLPGQTNRQYNKFNVNARVRKDAFHRKDNRRLQEKEDKKKLGNLFTSIVESISKDTNEIMYKVPNLFSSLSEDAPAPVPIISPSIGITNDEVQDGVKGAALSTGSIVQETFEDTLEVGVIMSLDETMGDERIFKKMKKAKQFKDNALHDHGNVKDAIASGLKMKKMKTKDDKASNIFKSVLDKASQKLDNAHSFKEQRDGNVVDVISTGLKSFKDKVQVGVGSIKGIHKSKAKKSGILKSKKKSSKWRGGETIYEIPFTFTDPKTGESTEGTREIKCPADITELIEPDESYIPKPDKNGNIDPFEDRNEIHLMCHNAAIGRNVTNGLAHIYFHELAPSSVPSTSHSPSLSFAPSFSPSVSLAPSISFAPTKTSKDLTCRQRPSSSTSSTSSRRLDAQAEVQSSTLRRKDSNTIFLTKKDDTYTWRWLQETTEATLNDEVISSNISNTTPLGLNDTINAILEGVEVATKPDKNALAIANGWDPNNPNARPKFWYTLPFCDEVPTISPAPSFSFAPSNKPSMSHAPSLSLAPSPSPSVIPSDMPTISHVPSITAHPSFSPTRPGYQGPLTGFGCQLAKDEVTVIGVGADVEVDFVYELYTNILNISSSGVMAYLEDEMQSTVTPALLNCDVVNATRRLESSSGIQYLVAQPEDELFDGVCNVDLSVLEENQQCVRILAKMTAIVEFDYPYIQNDVKMEVLKTVKTSLDGGVYDRPEKGIYGTRFLGILQEDGTLAFDRPIGAISDIIAADKSNITGYGSAFISLAVVGAVMVALLAARKRKSTETIIMEELESDEEGEFYKGNSPKRHADDVTVRTASSTPKSEFSADLNATPRRYVKVLGGNDVPSTILDDLRLSEANLDTARTNSRFEHNTGDRGLGIQNATMDVHSCTSAMCEICKPWKNHDPTFLSTSTSNASPNAKAPSSDYKLERKRAYRIEDTVVL